MASDIINHFGVQIQTFFYLIMIINGILHVLFAGAVAKDAGSLNATSNKTVLVSASTWAFATLIGGVFVASIYWILHHSNLTRMSFRESNYE